MTDTFEDSAGAVPLSLVPVELDEGETSPVFVARVPCHAGRTLAARVDAGLTVEARRTGSGEPFVDIGAAPYDLAAFDGESVAFDFRLTAAAGAADSSPLAAVIRLDYA